MTHVQFLCLVQTLGHGEMVGHQVYCNRVKCDSWTCLFSVMEVTCWLELLLADSCLCLQNRKVELMEWKHNQPQSSWKAFLYENVKCKMELQCWLLNNAVNLWNVMRGRVCAHTLICQQDPHTVSVESSVLCKEQRPIMSGLQQQDRGRVSWEPELAWSHGM